MNQVFIIIYNTAFIRELVIYMV